MGVTGRQEMPDGLELMAPGPKLAAVLAGLDRARLVGKDLVRLAQARVRQLAYEQAQVWADILEIATVPYTDPDELAVLRVEDLEDWAEAEVAAALSWTSMATAVQVELARESIRRLPAIHAAMLAGLIDAPKAKVLCEGGASPGRRRAGPADCGVGGCGRVHHGAVAGAVG
jgi:hypothetical protein